jgi:hypothetical protein
MDRVVEGLVVNLEYVPLLRIQRELHGIPRGMDRFRQYLRTIGAKDGTESLEFPPLVLMNPMGRDHVAALLDALLALDADGIGARVTAEAAAQLAEEPGEFKVALVVADDLMGGGTNRYATEFSLRFPGGSTSPRPLPRWTKHFWVTGVLWSSEAPSERAVREAILTAAHRVAYWHRNGPARTLRAMLAQEGHVLARAGCTGSVLD